MALALIILIDGELTNERYRRRLGAVALLQLGRKVAAIALTLAMIALTRPLATPFGQTNLNCDETRLDAVTPLSVTVSATSNVITVFDPTCFVSFSSAAKFAKSD